MTGALASDGVTQLAAVMARHTEVGPGVGLTWAVARGSETHVGVAAFWTSAYRAIAD